VWLSTRKKGGDKKVRQEHRPGKARAKRRGVEALEKKMRERKDIISDKKNIEKRKKTKNNLKGRVGFQRGKGLEKAR